MQTGIAHIECLLLLALNVPSHLISFFPPLLSIPFLHFHAIPWIVSSTMWLSQGPHDSKA